MFPITKGKNFTRVLSTNLSSLSVYPFSWYVKNSSRFYTRLRYRVVFITITDGWNSSRERGKRVLEAGRRLSVGTISWETYRLQRSAPLHLGHVSIPSVLTQRPTAAFYARSFRGIGYPRTNLTALAGWVARILSPFRCFRLSFAGALPSRPGRSRALPPLLTITVSWCPACVRGEGWVTSASRATNVPSPSCSRWCRLALGVRERDVGPEQFM